MVQICYFFIQSFRSLHEIGINLDARYLYSVDTDNREITVKQNPAYMDGFWPDGVSSLSAIIGNNGAGKTSGLLYMIQALEDGNGEEEVMAIIIYRQNGVLCVYMPESYSYGYGIISDIPEPIHKAKQRPRMDIFYYSSYFRPYQNWFEPGEGEFRGVYNASDTWRLIKDYQDYANVDTMHRTESVGEHMDALLIQDNNRIVQLIHDWELRKLLPKNTIPQYIIISPNMSGYDRLNHERRKKNPQGNGILLPSFESSKEKSLADIVTASLCNIGVEYALSTEYVQNILDKWADLYKERKNVQIALTELTDEFKEAHEHIRELQEIILFLKEACETRNDIDVLYIDSNKPDSYKCIDKLRAYFSARSFVVAHYFDMYFSHVPYSTSRLSSGEYDMLKFFSRLYDAVCVQPSRFDNLTSPQLLLIDEAENSYHPEWQRKFVNMLMKFTQALYERIGKHKAFQIVLTTHSPILLSDIPGMFVNYLEKDAATGLTRVSTRQPETFGTNVFELYKHAFFMHEGLIGEFAQDKITAIQYAIENRTQTRKEILQTIELIGDKAIKAYLYSLLERDYEDEMLSYYQHKVSELKDNKHATDKQQ